MVLLLAAAGCGEGATTELSNTTQSGADAVPTSTTSGGQVTSTTAGQAEEDPDDTGDDGDYGTTNGAAYPEGPFGWTPECVGALVTFLKVAEPALAAIDWSTATRSDEVEINAQFSTEADTFEALIADRDCEADMLGTVEGLTFVRELVVVHVPGAVGYIDYFIAQESG
jgi:hypothetical protein